MATPKAAWGIEIGAYAIKAVRLESNGDQVEVSDFAMIPHKKVLTTPDLDQDEMVRLSLGQFISQKSLEGEHMVMSVPGHSAFARFAKLPPVEPRKVPDIVKFEAVQQIPFPIEEVEWDYQTFTSEDTPEVEVGIFAITRERVQRRLGLYSELGVVPEALTLSPVAVYNALNYDGIASNVDGPVVFLDIGTQATDVIVAEAGRCWIRTFPLGGTHFTEAIANSFHLSYSKAEKLKKEAATSKYAKQIMQAMRPVFSDLLQDLQRSIGYYNSLGRGEELTTMIGLGSTFRIPGLRKFLGQQLQINVHRLDEYRRIAVTGREAASFAENAVSFATAYGLALQGLGRAEIAANLVPVKALRDQMWHQKTKWFAAAAAIVIAGAGMTLFTPLTQKGQLDGGEAVAKAQRVIDNARRLKSEYEQIQAAAGGGPMLDNVQSMLAQRTIWPYLVDDAANSLMSTQPQPELLSGNELQILSIDPEDRRLVQLEDLASVYSSDGRTRRMQVTMLVEVSHRQWDRFLNDTVATWLRENAEPTGARADVPYRIIPSTVSINPSRRQVIEVADDGSEAVTSSGSGPTDTPGAASPAGGGTPGASSGGFTGSDSGGGGGKGRRGGSGGGRAAPGGGLSAGSSGGGRGATPAGGGMAQPGGTPSRPTGTSPNRPGGDPFTLSGSTSSSGGAGDDDDRSINELAPLPDKPRLYPPGTTYYLVPITFELELLDPNQPTPGGQASVAGGQQEQAS
jgi:type IV pilus assembly protein PilM